MKEEMETESDKKFNNLQERKEIIDKTDSVLERITRVALWEWEKLTGLPMADIAFLFKVYQRLERLHSPNVYFMNNRQSLGKLIAAFLTEDNESLQEEHFADVVRLLADYKDVLKGDGEDCLISGYRRCRR